MTELVLRAIFMLRPSELHWFYQNGAPHLLPDQWEGAAIVQGRYDLVTPPATAWQIHRAWAETQFHLVADAGHAHTEPGIRHRLVEATVAT